MKRLCLALMFFCLMFAKLTAANPSDNALVLNEPRVLWEELAPFVRVFEDVTRGETIATVPDKITDPVDGSTVNFGYTKSVIWMRLSLQNARDDEQWRMRVRENFFQIFEVYLLRNDGQIEPLTVQDSQSRFTDRSVPYPELVVPIDLAPEEQVDVLIRFWSGGSSEVSFELMTRTRFEEWAARKTAKNFVYYGMMILLIVAAIFGFVATGRRVFVAYAIYAFCGLMFVMHADGNTFKYLWPQSPGLNANMSIVVGGALILFGGVFAREFLQTYLYHPVMDKVLVAMMAIVLVTAASGFVVDPQPIKKLLVFESLIAVLVFTGSGFWAMRTRFREVRFFVLAWSGAVISSAIMNMRHWLGIEISEEAQFDSMRIVFVADAALMGFAILDRFNQLRRNRRRVLEQSLREAERNVTLSARLQELDGQYRQLEDLAATRRQSMADAAHDLRQPLHALRANIKALVSNAGTAQVDAGEVEDTLIYLERLVSSGLEDASKTADLVTDNNSDLNAVLSAVADMFADDAQDKGLALKTVATTAKVQVPAFVLMRVLSNLVSNAIKYTETGTVLIGAKRDDGLVWVEIHDTGVGMTHDQFTRAQERNARLDQTAHVDGQGLGLDIVMQLADEHGLDVMHDVHPSGGSVVRVSLGPDQAP